jgi:putative NIF3 family GTP cyclohydrolase 1 type 2
VAAGEGLPACARVERRVQLGKLVGARRVDPLAQIGNDRERKRRHDEHPQQAHEVSRDDEEYDLDDVNRRDGDDEDTVQDVYQLDGEILSKLMGSKIAVYSPHTAHDSAFFGINRQLAAGLELLDVRPLIPGTTPASREALDGLEPSVADFVAHDLPAKDAKSDAAAPLLGAGRIGRCEKPTTFAALIEQVKDMLQIPALLAVGDDKKTIRKVAIGCGAADDFVGNAADAGADALLLGEARFHACLEARARGIGLILAGHYATERFAACILADRIARKFPALSVKASDKESDPIRVV